VWPTQALRATVFKTLDGNAQRRSSAGLGFGRLRAACWLVVRDFDGACAHENPEQHKVNAIATTKTRMFGILLSYAASIRIESFRLY
jgi:hypothetical protein